MTEQRIAHRNLLKAKTSAFEPAEFLVKLGGDVMRCNEMAEVQTTSVEIVRELVN